jgi:hypothetical protein
VPKIARLWFLLALLVTEIVVLSSFITVAGVVTDVSCVPGEDFSGVSDEHESLMLRKEAF